MKFKLFIQALEKSLGYHHIPFNRDGDTIQNLFDGTPVQSEFVIKFVRAVYKDNNCASLDSNITKTITENVLAETRLAALQSKKIDIDTFNFIEDLCLAIDSIFKSSENNEIKQTKEVQSTKNNLEKKTANVVPISQKRHLRWLKSSA